MSHSRREDVDGDIRLMLEAFAGAAQPSPSLPRRRHAVTLRALVILAAAVLALGLAVPGSLALLGNFSETPQEFVGDTTQPLNARKAIQEFMTQRSPYADYTLTSVQRVVTGNTPDGEYGLYALSFTGGVSGMAVISSATGGVAGMTYGPPAPCPAGWALEPELSMVYRPGKTSLYIAGLASPSVASIGVRYPDGRSLPAAVSEGYFLAWAPPLPGANADETGVAVPVTLVASDSAGNEIGHLAVGRTGTVPRRPGESPQAPSCG